MFYHFEGLCKNPQLEAWRSRIADTFDAQREAIFGMLHGIYCDPASGEEARVNALAICMAFKSAFTPKTQSDLIDRHQDYRAKGDEPRHKASQQFFERLDLLALLGDTELHTLITTASASLLSVHNDFNNFYNESPFATRLAGLATQYRIPETAQYDFVDAVVTCATGNAYGVSRAAMPHYESMIRSFSPNEVKIMLELSNSNSLVGRRIHTYSDCRERFKNLVRLLDVSSVPISSRITYDRWMRNT